jgi:hypothetical protein
VSKVYSTTASASEPEIAKRTDSALVTGDSARERRWSYPPDYVSAETLAYRQDCSRSTIDAYVRLGLLPKPETIGNLQRWDFGQVKAFIKTQNAVMLEAERSASGEEDAYLKGLKGGSAKKGSG